MTGRTLRRLGERRGVALMLVLWVVIVLSAIALGVVASSRAQTNLADTLRSRAVARYAAESGVAAATVRLRELLQAAPTAEEKTRAFARFEAEVARSGERELGGARYQVAVVDLGSRVDLNNSDEEVVFGLLEQLFGDSRAEELLAALLDWTDEDGDARPEGAEARDYERAGSPFRPANRPLLRLDELTRIQGFSDSIAGILAPYVAVWGNGQINVNTAPLPVLAALPEIGPEAAAYIVAARERDELMASRAAVWQQIVAGSGGRVAPQLFEVSTLPGQVLIISRGWAEGHPLTHEIQAAVGLEGVLLPGETRIQVRHWTERDL